MRQIGQSTFRSSPSLTAGNGAIAGPSCNAACKEFSMFNIIGVLSINPNSSEKLQELLKPLLEASRSDSGCISYECKPDALNKDTYLFLETWQDDASLDAHMKTKHFKTFVEAVDSILEAPLELHKILLD